MPSSSPRQPELDERGSRAEPPLMRPAGRTQTHLSRAQGPHGRAGWRIGADGEEKVAARLAKLVKKDPRWRSLHAIPVGENGSDIDHLVIGPGGTFTLNSKHHPRGSCVLVEKAARGARRRGRARGLRGRPCWVHRGPRARGGATCSRTVAPYFVRSDE